MSTELVALVIALLAVVFGPLIQLYMFKQQTKTQLKISEKRNKTQLATSKEQIRAQLAISESSIKSQLAVSNQSIKAQLATSSQQLSADVLSNNRQQWINSLRDQISEFVSLVVVIATTGDTKLLEPSDQVEKGQRAVLLRTRIELMINPGEEDHNELLNLIKTATRIVISRDSRDLKKLARVYEKIITVSQGILKREWGRVKSFE